MGDGDAFRGVEEEGGEEVERVGEGKEGGVEGGGVGEEVIEVGDYACGAGEVGGEECADGGGGFGHCWGL